MDIRIFEYYIVVSKELNITRAAEKLNLTQPTLSRQMKYLEETLGVKLFKRTNHNIELTDEGVLLRRQAINIVDAYTRITNQFSGKQEVLTGIIRIGLMESETVEEIAVVANAFQEKYPLVKFDWITEQPDELVLMLKNNEIHFAILPETHLLPSLSSVHLSTADEWGLYAHESVFDENKTVLTPEDISKQ